jgi:hypothetical protein
MERLSLNENEQNIYEMIKVFRIWVRGWDLVKSGGKTPCNVEVFTKELAKRYKVEKINP